MDAGLNYHVYCGGNPVGLFDALGLLMSAGELGIGNPGSYGGTNTNDSMYGSNGRGTGNSFGGGDGEYDPAKGFEEMALAITPLLCSPINMPEVPDFEWGTPFSPPDPTDNSSSLANFMGWLAGVWPDSIVLGVTGLGGFLSTMGPGFTIEINTRTDDFNIYGHGTMGLGLTDTSVSLFGGFAWNSSEPGAMTGYSTGMSISSPTNFDIGISGSYTTPDPFGITPKSDAPVCLLGHVGLSVSPLPDLNINFTKTTQPATLPGGASILSALPGVGSFISVSKAINSFEKRN